jgi:hypothetical protein
MTNDSVKYAEWVTQVMSLFRGLLRISVHISAAIF